ncbi:MAG: sensor histidine kinase [Chitinophagaceae bacterium]
MTNQSIEEILNEMTLLNNELINTQRDLAKKSSEVEKLNLQLKKSNAELQQFASIVSHNLRTPVANIVGLSSILKDAISEEDKASSQELLFKAVERLNEVIEDLSKILKTKSQINEINEVIYFDQLVSNIKSSIHILLEKEKVQFTTDFRAIDKITSNKSYIYSIFYNLISNSIKYKQIGRPPVINIVSEIDKNKILLYFKDNGAGIDLKKNGDKLFGLYKRFNHDAEGKGLGLFMVKTQIESLGGNIKAESIVGVGTEFTIEIPSPT